MNDTEDASAWSIVLLGARSLIGKLQGFARRELTSAYELAVQTVATPQGPASALTIRPILLLASLTSFTLPENALVIPLAKLSKKEQALLLEKLAQAETMRITMETGLSLR